MKCVISTGDGTQAAVFCVYIGCELIGALVTSGVEAIGGVPIGNMGIGIDCELIGTRALTPCIGVTFTELIGNIGTF